MHNGHPLRREQGRQRHIADHLPHAAADHRLQPSSHRRLGADGLIESEWVGYAIARVSVDDGPLLIREDDLFRRRIEIEQALVVDDHILNERFFDPQPRGADDPPRLAELEDQRLLGLGDNI